MVNIKLKIWQKLFLGFSSIIVLTALISFVGYSSNQTLKKRIEKADRANKIIKTALSLRISEKNFITQNDNKYLNEIDGKLKEVTSMSDLALSITTQKEDIDNLKNINTNVKLYKESIDKLNDNKNRTTLIHNQLFESIDIAFSHAQTYKINQITKMQSDIKNNRSKTKIINRITKSEGANNISNMVLRLRADLLNYMKTNNELYIDNMREELINVNKEINESLAVTTKQVDIDDLMTVKKQSTLFKENIEKLLSTDKEHDALVNNLSAYGNVVIQNAETFRTGQKDKMMKLFERTELKLLLGSIIALLLGSLAGTLIVRSVNKPIKTLYSELKELARMAKEGGRLNRRIEVNSEDEIGEMAEAVNEFIVAINMLLTKVKKNITMILTENLSVTGAIDNIVKGNESEHKGDLEFGIVHLKERINETMDNIRSQTAAVEETLAGIQQITSTAAITDKNAQETLAISERAMTEAKSGLEDVIKLNKTMLSIDESVSDANVMIGDLTKLSTNIEDIIEAITAISEQTHLLALNAAIEAARAGEAGKGFAVVADEIKKLAEGTNQETKKIEEIIFSIQSQVENVKFANQRVVENVESGKAINEEVTRKINIVLDVNRENKEKVSEISDATKEQKLATDEIVKAITNISDSACVVEEKEMSNTNIVNETSSVLMNKLNDVLNLSNSIEELNLDLARFETN